MPKQPKQKHGDQELEDHILNLLMDQLTESGREINVSARDGIVSLWGIVDVLAVKLEAARIVRGIPGVEGVDNGLTVAMDNFLPDRDINALVVKALSSSHDPAIRKLGAETRDGVVFLLGHAQVVAAVREAELLAARVRGVKEVQSRVKVGEDLHLDDASIANAVERALVNSGRAEARKITTSADRGVVKLQGMLDTFEEIEEAVDLVYRVPGVRAVHSELRARHGVTAGDRALTNQLRELLSREDLSRGTLKVHVVNGMAFLSGEVFDVDSKRRAEEVARQLSGITGISNTIQVSAHNL